MADPEIVELRRLRAENARLRAAIDKFLVTQQTAVNDTLCGTVETWLGLIEGLPVPVLHGPGTPAFTATL
jgi:hypothetical protein